MSRGPAPWGLIVSVAVLAFAVRFLYVVALRSSPFFEALLVDAAWHHDWAGAWADGTWSMEGRAFFRAPLYPLLVSWLYRLTGPDLFALRLAQAALGAITAGSLCYAGFRLGGRGAAMACGVIASLYGPLVFFDGEVLIPTLLVVLLSTSAAVLLAPPSRGRTAVSFALLGLAVIARPTALVLLPVWLFRVWGGTRRWSVAGGVLLALAPALLVTGVNWRAEGVPVFVASQGGVNLYAGNHPGATGRTVEIPELGGVGGRWVDFVARSRAVAEADRGSPLDSGAVSRYWVAKTLSGVADDPNAWLGLMTRKLYYAINAYETPSNRDPYFQQPWPLRPLMWASPWLVFPWGLLFPFAVAAAVVFWRSQPSDTRFLLLWITVYLVAVALFFVNGRFRMGAVPPVILLAGWGVSRWRELLRPGAAVAGVVALLVVNGAWADARSENRAQAFAKLGAAEMALGQTEASLSSLAEAYRLDPTPKHAYLLAQGYAFASRNEEARTWFLKARDSGVDPTLLLPTAVTLEDLGYPKDAEEVLRLAVTWLPRDEAAWVELGLVLGRAGDEPAALAAWEEGAALNPRSVTLRFNLAVGSGRLGLIETGLEWANQALALSPGNAEILEVRDWLLQRR